MNRPILAAAVLWFALTANAGAKTTQAAALPTASDSDRAALATVITDAVTDVKLCDLAVQRSQDQDVIGYCRSASADDGHIAVQAAQLASRLGASDGSLLTSQQMPPAVDSLAQRSGHDFDRSFLLTRIAIDGNCGHELRFASEFTTNPALKRFESGVMPVIYRHLDEAETLLRRLSEALP